MRSNYNVNYNNLKWVVIRNYVYIIVVYGMPPGTRVQFVFICIALGVEVGMSLRGIISGLIFKN